MGLFVKTIGIARATMKIGIYPTNLGSHIASRRRSALPSNRVSQYRRPQPPELKLTRWTHTDAGQAMRPHIRRRFGLLPPRVDMKRLNYK